MVMSQRVVCAGRGVAGLQKMGAEGNHIFRLLWVQIGKGNQSKHAFCNKGAKNVPLPRVYFLLEQCQVWLKQNSEVGQGFWLLWPSALVHCPLLFLLEFLPSQHSRVNLLLPPTGQGLLTMTPLTVRWELGMGSPFPFLFLFNH